MRIHWITGNILVLLIIVTMLGMTQFAMAVQKPFPCWTCCDHKLGPCTPPPNCWIACAESFKMHVAAGNVYAIGKKATKAQLLAAAQAITTWADGDENHDMAAFFSKVDVGVKAVGISYFTGAKVDGSRIYAGVAQYGNLVPESIMTTMLLQSTQAEIQWMYNHIVSIGSEQMVWEYATYLTEVANGMPVQLPQGYFGTLIMVGAVMGLIAATGGGAGFALLGIMIGMGGVVGNYAGNWQNMKEGRENASLTSPMAVGIPRLTANRSYALVN